MTYDDQFTKVLKQAEQAGQEYGRNAGSWAIDGNTSSETYRRILDGYEDGDPEIMDMCPAPLSGEWADGLLIRDVLEHLGVTEDDDWADDLLTSFENGYSDGYWEQVIADCRYQVS